MNHFLSYVIIISLPYANDNLYGNKFYLLSEIKKTYRLHCLNDLFLLSFKVFFPLWSLFGQGFFSCNLYYNKILLNNNYSVILNQQVVFPHNKSILHFLALRTLPSYQSKQHLVCYMVYYCRIIIKWCVLW